MGNQVGYLPDDLATRARTVGQANDADAAWETARIAEQAFARGYDLGYMRATTDKYVKIEQQERRRAAAHEDTCPARRRYPTCHCATRPHEVPGA